MRTRASAKPAGQRAAACEDAPVAEAGALAVRRSRYCRQPRAVVVVKEDLLERGLAGVQRSTRWPASAAITGRRPRRGTQRVGAGALDLTPSSAGQLGAGPERDLDRLRGEVAQLGKRPLVHEPPARRIPMRSQSASTSLRMWEERNTLCPRCLASTRFRGTRPPSGGQDRRGLVEDQQVGAAANAAMSCTFCRLPFESARTFLRRRAGSARRASRGRRRPSRRAGARGTRTSRRSSARATGTALLRRRPRAGVRRPVRSTRRRRTAPPAGARAVQPQQQADGRGLAGAVGPEVAVDLAVVDRQVQASSARVSP